MRLEAYGYDDRIVASRKASGLWESGIGRVIAEHRARYVVATESGDVEAEIAGALRHSARGREDFSAVGDWVALDIQEDGASIIHGILPRTSTIARRSVDGFGEVQVIAANVDCALLVQACDRDFNLKRLERYLAICRSSKVDPIVVLTKTDLIDGSTLAGIIEDTGRRIGGIPVVAVSDRMQSGYDALVGLIQKGRTYCMLGSSGVGKSTLLNRVSGRGLMRTDTISESTGKGRHVTSHRELVVLEGGGILVDNPGMREVGVADQDLGLETTFDRLLSFSRTCRFRDCTHTAEVGCGILEALRNGDLEQESYESWRKLEKEKTHFESSVVERRKKDKAFGKMVDVYKKEMGRRGA